MTNDLDGNPRPQGAGFDVGAYESALLDLRLTKSAPSLADLGEPFTYTLVITNAGPALATDVIVTDALPANVNLISVSDNCVASSVVTCAFGALPAGVAGSAQIVVSATVAGTVVNNAEAIADQFSAVGLPPTTASASTTIVQREATTTTVQSHPNPSIVGQSVDDVLRRERDGVLGLGRQRLQILEARDALRHLRLSQLDYLHADSSRDAGSPARTRSYATRQGRQPSCCSGRPRCR